MAVIARMTRASLLDVLGEDYIRTAWAKGLRERVVIVRHALKNAFIPTLTVIALQFGYLLGGAVITETIFAWPGVGRWLFLAVQARDFRAVQGGVLLLATVFVLANLIAGHTLRLAGSADTLRRGIKSVDEQDFYDWKEVLV